MIKLPNVGVIENHDEIQMLETRLQATLIQVQPQPEFVQGLKRRLLKENELEVDEPKLPLFQKLLWTVAGLLSGALLLVLGVRGVLALVNSLKNGISPKNPATPNPA